MKVKVISLPYIFQVLYVLCFTRPRYQVSVYRTIGPLVVSSCGEGGTAVAMQAQAESHAHRKRVPQPHQACNDFTPYTLLKAYPQQRRGGGTAVAMPDPHPRSTGTGDGSPHIYSGHGEEGTAVAMKARVTAPQEKDAPNPIKLAMTPPRTPC